MRKSSIPKLAEEIRRAHSRRMTAIIANVIMTMVGMATSFCRLSLRLGTASRQTALATAKVAIEGSASHRYRISNLGGWQSSLDRLTVLILWTTLR